MPLILVKNYNWRQTNEIVLINVPVTKNPKKVNLFAVDNYLKVNTTRVGEKFQRLQFCCCFFFLPLATGKLLAIYFGVVSLGRYCGICEYMYLKRGAIDFDIRKG